MVVYLTNGSAQTIAHAATLRWKFHILLAASPSYSILTSGQPAPITCCLSQLQHTYTGPTSPNYLLFLPVTAYLHRANQPQLLAVSPNYSILTPGQPVPTTCCLSQLQYTYTGPTSPNYSLSLPVTVYLHRANQSQLLAVSPSYSILTPGQPAPITCCLSQLQYTYTGPTSPSYLMSLPVTAYLHRANQPQLPDVSPSYSILTQGQPVPVTCCLSQLQHTYPGPTSPSSDPISTHVVIRVWASLLCEYGQSC